MDPHHHASHDSPFMWMPTDPPTWANLFSWHPQPIPLTFLIALVAAVFYHWGVVRLHMRGKSWPWTRALSFALGIISIVILCGSAFNGYSMALFSVHMVQHMALSMLTPPLLLAGQPLTLTLRAFEGTALARLAERFAMSAPMKLLTFVPVALVVFLAGMYALYFTPVFDQLMANWLGHEVMLMYYIASGILLLWPVLGLDPSPHHMSRPIAFIAAILPTPFHSFFAVLVMQSERLIVQTFAHPPVHWLVDPVADQQLGGGLAWAFADIPALVVIGVIVTQWVRESRSEAVESDRRADETHDAELEEYNAWLASGSSQD